MSRAIWTLAVAATAWGVGCTKARAPTAEPCCSAPEQCLEIMEAEPNDREGFPVSDWTACSARAMASFGPRSLPFLIDALDDSDESLVDGASVALVELKEQGRPAIPALIQACGRAPDTSACWALGVFEDPRAIDVLVQHLDKGTGAYLEGMAELAAERLIEEMLDRDATIQTLMGALVVLKEVQALPKGSLTKVRTALRVELSASELALPEGCTVEPCTPRLAYLLELAALWKREALALEPELLDAWRWKDAEVAREARRALAAAGAPEIWPALERELSGKALSDAGQAGRDLEALGGERAVSLLQKELMNPVGDSTSAAASLGKLGRTAEPALPQLRTLADTHWRESTRLAAARAVSTITGEPLEAAPLRCPSVRETNGIYSVALGARTWSMSGVGGQVARTARCRAARKDQPVIASYDDGRACLLSVSRGEWGGWTEVHEPDHEPYQLPRTQALRFIQIGDELLVIHGLLHGFGSGWLTELRRGRDESWSQSTIANLHAYPRAFAVHEGRLLLLIEPREPLNADGEISNEPGCANTVVQFDPRQGLSAIQ